MREGRECWGWGWRRPQEIAPIETSSTDLSTNSSLVLGRRCVILSFKFFEFVLEKFVVIGRSFCGNFNFGLIIKDKDNEGKHLTLA